MSNWRALYRQHKERMEDFWGRRGSAPRFRRKFELFGVPVHLVSNEKKVLTAVDHSLPLFSTAPSVDQPPFTLQFVVQAARRPPGPPPDSLLDGNWYTGDDSWLMIHLGGWGHAHVELARRRATAVIAPELAARPELVSQSLLNTILLNFCLSSGFGLLHASCLYRDGKVLLLMAPHNSGKSTTALYLALTGYALLTDSMVHISPYHAGTLLCGFPVGTLKLRADILPRFPHLRPFLRGEQVRDETKFTLDLRQLPQLTVMETAVSPTAVELCLLSRGDQARTRLSRATKTAVWQAVMANSLFYDTEMAWQRNLARIKPLIERARAHHLVIGHDPAGMVQTIEQLWSDKS